MASLTRYERISFDVSLSPLSKEDVTFVKKQHTFPVLRVPKDLLEGCIDFLWLQPEVA